MTYSALWFSQLQFFGSLSFMLVFFAMELGLSWLLLFYRIRAMSGPHSVWVSAYRFWVRVFALAFILSFASSLPVLIQLGSIWPNLIVKIGEVSGPIFTVGMLSAFVFKSCFLGAMLFGYRSMPAWLHSLAVFLVAVGNTFTAACFVALVSWMHVPTGATLNEGLYEVEQWVQVLLNPAFAWYFAQFVCASLIAASCFVVGVTAAKALGRPCDESERRVFRLGLWVMILAVVGLAVAVVGNGLMVAEHQPYKAAATAGYWISNEAPRFLWFAIPFGTELKNLFALGWTGGEVWLSRDAEGQLIGLDQSAGMLPPVALVFYAFRLAALLGLVLLGSAIYSLWKSSSQHYDAAALPLGWRRYLSWQACGGWLLLIAGLAYQLFGALPYVVYGTTTISEVFANNAFNHVLAGLLAYVVVYTFCLAGFFLLIRYITRHGVVPVARRRGRA